MQNTNMGALLNSETLKGVPTPLFAEDVRSTAGWSLHDYGISHTRFPVVYDFCVIVIRLCCLQDCLSKLHMTI